LYFASWRLVIASSFQLLGFEDRALLCPGFPEPTGFEAKRGVKTAGRETSRGPAFLGVSAREMAGF
jgi:hypothetical protein